MRPIKFRGYYKGVCSPETWYYGDLVQNNHNEGDTWIRVGTSAHMAPPESVGQFTGLKDQHGIEIYEGDIVKNTNYDFNGAVAFSAGGFQVDFSDSYTTILSVGEYWEVIGNIYETPELLEQP